MHIPQYILNYGHSVYNTYIKIFRKSVLSTKYKFTILEYILCRASSFTALIKPPTCGVRIFGINSGRIRGVIPLKNFIFL